MQELGSVRKLGPALGLGVPMIGAGASGSVAWGPAPVSLAPAADGCSGRLEEAPMNPSTLVLSSFMSTLLPFDPPDHTRLHPSLRSTGPGIRAQNCQAEASRPKRAGLDATTRSAHPKFAALDTTRSTRLQVRKARDCQKKLPTSSTYGQRQRYTVSDSRYIKLEADASRTRLYAQRAKGRHKPHWKCQAYSWLSSISY